MEANFKDAELLSTRSSKSFELKCNRRYEPRNKKKGEPFHPFSVYLTHVHKKPTHPILLTILLPREQREINIDALTIELAS